MKISSRCRLVVLAAAVLGGPAAVAELPTREYLPHALAQKMIGACVRLAAEKGWRMHVAIKDPGDNLLAYVRMDGSPLGSQSIALQKASTAARTGWSTAQLGQMAFDRKTGAPTAMAFAPDNILFPGGLPILSASGQLLGGIGVSGARPDEDVQCAQAALEAVKAEL